MTEQQAREILEQLFDRFPGIDARVDVSKKPYYATQEWKATADIPIYQDGLCILVLTSITQFVGFMKLCQSFIQIA